MYKSVCLFVCSLTPQKWIKEKFQPELSKNVLSYLTHQILPKLYIRPSFISTYLLLLLIWKQILIIYFDFTFIQYIHNSSWILSLSCVMLGILTFVCIFEHLILKVRSAPTCPYFHDPGPHPVAQQELSPL